jgi:hypothetical protein
VRGASTEDDGRKHLRWSGHRFSTVGAISAGHPSRSIRTHSVDRLLTDDSGSTYPDEVEASAVPTTLRLEG